MNGPIKKHKIGFGGSLEFLTVLAGLTVVLGLWKESWTEWVQALRDCAWPLNNCRWPSNNVEGSLLVALGVFAEVTIGIFIARSSKREQIESATVIAELGERAASAEQLAAEANLARVKIEQRMRPRFLAIEDLKALIDLLTPHAGRLVDIIVFDHHVPETLNFAGQLTSVFVSSKWRVRKWESRKVTHRLPGAPVLVAMATEHVTGDSIGIAKGFADVLNAVDIDCGISPGTFGCKGEFEPGAFQMIFEKPIQVFGNKGVSPFRIQIGAKQLSPLPPPIVVIGRPGAPPQP